jgi:hypothetical protein
MYYVEFEVLTEMIMISCSFLGYSLKVTFNRLHSVISHKTDLVIIAAGRQYECGHLLGYMFTRWR